MEYTGLVRKFDVNRPIKEEEVALQLHQKQRINQQPADQMACIRINSTYLEMTDAYYTYKGWISGFIVAAWFLTGGLWIYSAINDIAHPGPYFEWWDACLSIALAFILAAPVVWLLRFECFRYTHYPIRFNRKTRQVHVYRIDGTILTAPWDDLFFCLGRTKQRNWTVQGHVLNKERNVVLETFSLAMLAASIEGRELLKQFWEFPRRYMEEGPQAVVEYAAEMLPIAERRESFLFGLYRTIVANGVAGWVMVPFYIFFYPGRWLALRSCKIPKWPNEIEVKCAVDPQDPHIRDAATNPRRLRG